LIQYTEQERQGSEQESLFREQLGKDREQGDWTASQRGGQKAGEAVHCAVSRSRSRRGCTLYSQQKQEQERLYTVQSAGAGAGEAVQSAVEPIHRAGGAWKRARVLIEIACG
jgi:hypothetical protein